MDQKDIQDLIKLINKSDISEFRLKEKDFSLVIRTNDYVKNNATTIVSAAPQMAAPVQAAAPAAQVAVVPSPSASENTPAPVADESKLITFKSPIVGTFYRKPSPDKPVFAKVDDKVTPGMVICVIEAMKLFNEIECEVSGTIVKVLVDDATPVEYDQPLFLIDPA